MRSDLKFLFSGHPSLVDLRVGDLDVVDACRRFEAEGYVVHPVLREFIENFSEVVVTWMGAMGREVTLSTTIEDALDANPGNIRIYSRRLNREVFPVGMAFCTEERVLLADNGDILFGGDAGLQRVANGFQESLRALIEDDWDKTFFW